MLSSAEKMLTASSGHIRPVQETVTKLAVKNITFELTNACNLRCEFCTIWQEQEKQILPPGKIIEFLTSEAFKHPLASITLTGGEIFLYPHLQKLFRALVALRLKHVLRTIALSSNGYSMLSIKRFLQQNKEYLKDVELFISIDGSEHTHNLLRGRNDAYQKTMETIREVREQYPDIKLSLKSTIQERNIDDIEGIYRFCKEQGIKLLLKPMESSNASYYHRDYRLEIFPSLAERVSFSEESRKKIISLLERMLREEQTAKTATINADYILTIVKYLKGTFAVQHCATPKHYLFITSSGKIYPCLYQKSVNILQEGWEERFQEKEYIELMNNAAEGKCPGCIAHHGYLKYWNFLK